MRAYFLQASWIEFVLVFSHMITLGVCVSRFRVEIFRFKKKTRRHDECFSTLLRSVRSFQMYLLRSGAFNVHIWTLVDCCNGLGRFLNLWEGLLEY